MTANKFAAKRADRGYITLTPSQKGLVEIWRIMALMVKENTFSRDTISRMTVK